MTTVGSIGIGILILIILWILTLFMFVYSVKAQSNIGWISLGLATCITIILVIIPIEEKQEKQEELNLEKDYNSIYKSILLFFLIICSLIAGVFLFFLHCIKPIQVKLITTI